MVTVQEATDVILAHPIKPRVETVPFHNSIGRVLAEKIMADRDFPPFDRVTMDGIAIAFDEWKAGYREFAVEDIQAAGSPQKSLRDVSNCIEVMTGAILPEGTDTVIRYEDVNIQNDKATVLAQKLERGQFLHLQGNDARKGTVLLEPGIALSPAEIALLASVGKSEVSVYAFPKTAIISSGDELVGVTEEPELYQIRRSNAYAIEGAMEQMKWEGRQYHLPDRKDFLLDSLRVIEADHDVLILSGGVSKGKFDFIPEVLEEIGIQRLFHEVKQRPGKPFWFGVSKKGKVVFALPGNPVSTYMCFYRYIKPWLLRSFGAKPATLEAVLAQDFSFAPELTHFLQVSVKVEQGCLKAYAQPGSGSGDFANLKHADGFLELPADRQHFKAGEAFPYIPFRLG